MLRVSVKRLDLIINRHYNGNMLTVSCQFIGTVRYTKALPSLYGRGRAFCFGGIAKLAKAASLQGAIAGSKPAPAYS